MQCTKINILHKRTLYENAGQKYLSNGPIVPHVFITIPCKVFKRSSYKLLGNVRKIVSSLHSKTYPTAISTLC